MPTIRCLRRILTDYEPMLKWVDEAVDAYIAGGEDEARLSTWRWHLSRLLASIGGVTGADPRVEAPTPLRIDEKPYERGITPKRDVRFDTYKHTGDYDAADGEENVTTKTPTNLYVFASSAPNVMKSTQSKPLAPLCGTSASKISMQNTISPASLGMKRDTSK